MDINKIQNPGQARDHANKLQSQIDKLQGEAQNTNGEDRQSILSKIEDLKKEKNQAMSKMRDLESKGKDLKNEAEGMMGKL